VSLDEFDLKVDFVAELDNGACLII